MLPVGDTFVLEVLIWEENKGCFGLQVLFSLSDLWGFLLVRLQIWMRVLCLLYKCSNRIKGFLTVNVLFTVTIWTKHNHCRKTRHWFEIKIWQASDSVLYYSLDKYMFKINNRQDVITVTCIVICYVSLTGLYRKYAIVWLFS